MGRICIEKPLVNPIEAVFWTASEPCWIGTAIKRSRGRDRGASRQSDLSVYPKFLKYRILSVCSGAAHTQNVTFS